MKTATLNSVIEALIEDQHAAIAERDEANAEYQKALDVYREVIQRRGTPTSSTDKDGWERFIAHSDEVEKSSLVVADVHRTTNLYRGMAHGKFYQAQKTLNHIKDALSGEGLKIPRMLEDARKEEF